MDGTICTPQDLQREFVHCLTRAETITLTLLVVAASASAFAVLATCGLILRNVKRERKRISRRKLIQQPMDVYMISLLAADMLHSLGSLLNIKWIADGISDAGAFCTVQGILNQSGPVSVALNTLVIAVVTVIAIWWRRGVPKVTSDLNVTYIIVALIWLLVTALVVVPAAQYSKPSDVYWAPTPLWCTISSRYEITRLWAKYLWLWVTFLGSVILYIPLSLWTRGNITMDPDTWWKFSVHRRRNDAEEQGRPGWKLFFAMVSYPLSNAILIVPLSVVRWVQLNKSNSISTSTSIAVAIIFDLSGLTNVLLLLYIRPNLLLFGDEDDGDSGRLEGGGDWAHCACCVKRINNVFPESVEMVPRIDSQGKPPSVDRDLAIVARPVA